MHTKYGIFALACAIAIIGCGAGTQNEKGQKTTAGTAGLGAAREPLTIGIVFDSGGLGDKSFNDSCWAGIERAKKDFGIKAIAVQSKSPKDYETNQAALAAKGCDLVIAVGVNQAAALKKVAPMHPEAKFALVDEEVAAPNVRSLKFKEEEGSFLVGYLAGLMTQTGKVGFVGGMELPLIEKFRCGFVAGARTANPNVVALDPKYTGDWNNADLAKAAANVLYGQGADIIFAAAGRAGLGVIQAAKDQKKWAIGVDSDQDYIAPGTVLTSMIKRVDLAVYRTIEDLQNGKFTASVQVFDLKADGVGTSEFLHTKDLIGEAKLAKLASAKEDIVSGKIRVPATPSELDKYLAQLPR